MPWDGMSGTLGRAEERRICKALDYFPHDRTENSSEILDENFVSELVYDLNHHLIRNLCHGVRSITR